MVLFCRSDPNPEVILNQVVSENMGVRALIDMCTTGTLMKKSLYDSLKHKTVDEPKAKTWTMEAGTFVTKKKAVISGSLLPLITNKHSCQILTNHMQSS